MGIFGRLARDGSADYVPVMRFEMTTTKPHVKEMPTRLVELSAASQASAVRRRQFIVNSGICMNRTQAGEHADMVALTGINGQTFDMERIDVETNLGTSEVWEVISVGLAHPFHIHGALFRILSIAGTPPPPHLAGWKDVVLVDDRAELLVAFNQPATRAHPFMYHCHILEQEEAGLMGQYVCA
jgi:FtsP/CotA-like multicopper oxidase with cupredoxin domain